MPSITSLGVGSGIDLEALVSNLLAAEETPVTNRLNLRATEVQASISAFAALKGSLSDFQSTITDLKDLSDFQSRLTSSSDSKIFTATATSDAVVGNYDIQVIDLAKAHKLVSKSFTDPNTIIGTGTLTITQGSKSFSVDAGTGSLSDIRDAINDAADNTGVTASILTVDDGVGGTESKLVFTTTETGADSQLSISVADDDTANEDDAGLSQLFYQDGSANNRLTQLDPAQNGKITIDGFAVSSKNNTFSDAIEGVTITAISETEDPLIDPPETLSVSLDTFNVKTKITEFVEVFNLLSSTLDQLTSVNGASGTGGLLTGDATTRTLEDQIRRLLFSEAEGLSSLTNNLVDIGITTTDEGKLTVDDDILTTALNERFDEIGQLFAGEAGVATKLDDLLDRYLNTSDGIIKAREDGFDTQLEGIQEDRETLARRLERIETRMRQQFAGLDALVAQLTSTGNFLTQQLDNTSKIMNRNNN